MSDQPVPTPPAPSTKSLDDILNQLEKSAGKSPAAPEPQPMVPVPSNQNPILSNTQATVPPAPTPVPEEKATQSEMVPVEPSPVVETPAAAPEMPPAPAPIATLPENPIPVPPPQERPEAAPMVKEEPIIDKQKAVEAPLPPPPPGEAPAQVPAPKSSNKGKIIAGVIGVLLLTGVAGIGVYFSRQQQNTQGAAYVPSTPLPQTNTAQASPDTTTSISVLPTPIPGATVSRAQISGTICVDKLKTPGTVTLYNATQKLTANIPIAKGQSTFMSSFPVGEVFVLYSESTTNGDVRVEGYTDTNHDLKAVTLSESGSASGISVCDTAMNPISFPTDGYQEVQ